MLVYLAGAIEYAPDRGRAWRREIAPFLRDELGHQVYDPAEDERKSLNEEEQRNLRRWKTEDVARFQRTVRKIIEFDLDLVSRADYIVCCWDEYCTKGAGTAAELTLAHRRGIPVYVVTRMPVPAVSGWILGCSTRLFSSFEELKIYLRKRKRLTNDANAERRMTNELDAGSA
jgi:nucleoside 2-deoxyribosyltransferase